MRWRVVTAGSGEGSLPITPAPKKSKHGPSGFLPFSAAAPAEVATAIRPDAPSGAEAMGGSGECRPCDKLGEPLVVNWNRISASSSKSR